MAYKIFRVFWPSRVSKASNKKSTDLVDKINALERQLRSYADDAQEGEETPLFGDVPDGNRRTAATPATYQTGEDNRNAPGYAGASTEHDLSRFEYSSKPIRIAAQLLRDILLYLKIIIVWFFERWYRWLLVAIPIALYISTYKFIFREDGAPADVVANYLGTFLILLFFIMFISATRMGSSSRASLLSNR